MLLQLPDVLECVQLQCSNAAVPEQTSLFHSCGLPGSPHVQKLSDLSGRFWSFPKLKKEVSASGLVVRKGILQMGKLWLQCRLELELAVLQDVSCSCSACPTRRGKATSPGLLVVLELGPFSLAPLPSQHQMGWV